ncbi:MAG: 50S ribosomal protein L1 [Acidiferrobacterales bacterium]
MAKISKRMKAISESIERGKHYEIGEALTLIKGSAKAKFDESVDVAVNLGVDARKSEQNVRGSTVLPRGTGKTVKVAVFAEGDQADAAKKAGADIVGMDDLAEMVKKGEFDWDIVIATPDAMKVVGKLGQILGPRGLMPNPKVGTVSANTEKAVTDAKSGQVQFRLDKAGIIHCTIGKASFDADALKENLIALIDALKKSKPASSKGTFIGRITLSTTMGPGVAVDTATLSQQK